MQRRGHGGMEAYQSTFVDEITSKFEDGQAYGLAGPVGSGKSYAIASALAELVSRGRVSRVLLCVPSASVDQWLYRLIEFGLAAEELTVRSLRLIREGLAEDTALWPKGVFIVDPRGVSVIGESALLQNVGWDLVVIDEADAVGGRLQTFARMLRTVEKPPAILVSANAASAPAALLGSTVVEFDWTAAVNEVRAIQGSRGPDYRLTKRYRRDPSEVEICAAAVSAAQCLGRERGLLLLQLAASSVNSLEAALLRWSDSAETQSDAQGRVKSMDCRTKVEGLLERVERLEVDSRLACLQELLSELHSDGTRHIVVYTSYRTTLEYLAAAIELMDVREWQIHGGLTGDERVASVNAFQRDGGLLISSLGVPVGLVGAVIHYDLPISASRLWRLEEDLHRRSSQGGCPVYMFWDETESLPNELLTHEMARQYDPRLSSLAAEGAGLADRIWAVVSSTSSRREPLGDQ